MRTSDLQKVAQWAKSNSAPSEVYNAACRLLDWQGEFERLQRLEMFGDEQHTARLAEIDRLQNLLHERTIELERQRASLKSLQAHADRWREKDWAYAAERCRERDEAWAHRDALIDEVKTLQADLEEFGEAEKTWLQWRRERDAFKAAIEWVRDDAIARRRATGITHDRWLLGAHAQACRTIRILNTALESPENGAESHGDGRNPQTRGASEVKGSREAQEASQ